MPPLPKSQAESERVQDIPSQIPSEFAPGVMHHRDSMGESQALGLRHEPQQTLETQIDSTIDSHNISKPLPVPSIRIQPPSPTRNTSFEHTIPATNSICGKLPIRRAETTRFLELVDRVRSWDRVTGTSEQRREKAGLLKVPEIQHKRSRGRANHRRRILKMPLEPYRDRIEISECSTEYSEISKKQKLSSSVAALFGLARNIQLESAVELDPYLSDFMGSDIPKARSPQDTSRIINAVAKSPEGTQYASPYFRLLPPVSEPKKTPPVFTSKVHKRRPTSLAVNSKKRPPTLKYKLRREQCTTSSCGCGILPMYTAGERMASAIGNGSQIFAAGIQERM